jgi:hypothetical protein
MQITRRQAIVSAATSAFLVLTAFARPGSAENRHALYGKWHVRCPDGHVDVVTQGTRQHKCETSGEQCFVNEGVTVMCPKGHANVVDLRPVDVLRSYKCTVCGVECEGWG